MKRLFLIFNHKITEEQFKSAKQDLNISEIIYMPDNLQKIWSNIQPLDKLNTDELKIIIDWIKNNASKFDNILVQGDFGATFYIVDFCLKNDLIPVYATTKREVKEKKDNNGFVEKTLVFKHINFRKYVRWENE